MNPKYEIWLEETNEDGQKTNNWQNAFDNYSDAQIAAQRLARSYPNDKVTIELHIVLEAVKTA